ncbi:MAG: hypothetical protein WBV35_14845, partial [Steroidobacteraceae bacterium]
WRGPVKDAQGHWIKSHVLNQDIVAWTGQGRIADRTQEHLGRSDAGIVMLRRCFDDNIQRVTEGKEPKGLIRDPGQNVCVELPIKHRELFTRSMTLEESRSLACTLGYRLNEPHYQHQVGQPDAVKLEYQIAMGMVPPDASRPI